MAAAGYRYRGARRDAPDHPCCSACWPRPTAAANWSLCCSDGLAALLPVKDYRAWLSSLPQSHAGRACRGAWGAPEKSHWVMPPAADRTIFVHPAPATGPDHPAAPAGTAAAWPPAARTRAPRRRRSTTPPPTCRRIHYLATYLWTRQHNDALVHYGTHGTQEWLPGKERGLSVYDAPLLALGDIPVAYPYIADNIGEATQAKRRGRATIVSHQTPPFAPGGLHDAADPDARPAAPVAGAGRGRRALSAWPPTCWPQAKKERVIADMGWTEGRVQGALRRTSCRNCTTTCTNWRRPPSRRACTPWAARPRNCTAWAPCCSCWARTSGRPRRRHAGVPAADLDEALVGPWDRLAQNRRLTNCCGATWSQAKAWTA
ncbi:cobaltochelatase [Alicycliphilus sp. B1]|nr:cobaltochelatase [Alicycliphilus sp. B1]